MKATIQKSHTLWNLVIAWGFLALISIPTKAVELTNTVVVAATGDAPPEGPGVLTNFDPPVLGNGGQPVFGVNVSDASTRTGYAALLSGDSTNLALIVKEGDATPNQDGQFSGYGFSTLRINSSNQVAFVNYLATSTTQGGNYAVFVADTQSSQIHQFARSKFPTPSGLGTYENAPFSQDYSVNNAGQLALYHRASFVGNVGVQDAIFRLNGTAQGDTEIAVAGQATPAGDDEFSTFAPPSVNASGQILFFADTTNQNPGIFMESGGVIEELLRIGDPTPSGDGTYSGFTLTYYPSAIAFNDLGQVGAFMYLENTSGGPANDEALYRFDALEAVEIFREGDPAPDGNGTFLSVTSKQVALNNIGQILFATTISGATNLASWGLFVSDGTIVTQIVRGGDPAPGGGTFSDLPSGMEEEIALNDIGQVVFEASVKETNGFVRLGLFFYHPAEGLMSIIRYGDTLPGLGAMTTVDFSGGTGPAGPEASGLNDLGQVSYRAILEGGDRVVAVWTGARVTPIAPPELMWELTGTNSLRLTWTQDGDNWILKSADDLTVGDWNPVGVEPVNQGGTNWSVELPIEGSARFWRLLNDSVD